MAHPMHDATHEPQDAHNGTQHAHSTAYDTTCNATHSTHTHSTVTTATAYVCEQHDTVTHSTVRAT